MGRKASDMRQHVPRMAACGRYLATRVGAATLLNRHPDLVSRHAEPVACDVSSKLALYDLDEVEAAVTTRRRRVA